MNKSHIDIVAFGEILWDIIDGVPHLGGAPFNLAAHASLCGLSTAVVSSLGCDELGDKAFSRAEELNINTSWIKRSDNRPTGTVSVKLVNALPEYTIHEQVAWDNIFLTDQEIGALAEDRPGALCFGTLAQRSTVSFECLKRILSVLKETLVFFDVNLRQQYWSAEQIEDCLKMTTWLKVNDEEALILNKEIFKSNKGIENFASNILEQFNIEGVLVTCGPEGCMVFEKGAGVIKSPAVEVEVIDTVGAGDAFSAAFLTALLQGRSAEQAAEIGNHRGAMVASRSGAIPVI